MRRLLQAAGATVTAEYYINDAGAQMDKFGASVLARAAGQEPPEDGYPGAYVADRAAEVLAQRPDLLELDPAEGLAVARDLGYVAQLAAIRRTLDDFGVHFDVWFSERSLHDGHAVEQAVARLREQGHVFDAEGAVWLRTTDFGDDKDRVLVRADGSPTYFAADAAYYLSKKDRGFDEKVYLLGADHHGYINRLKAIAAAAGDDPERNIEVKIGQLVNIAGVRMGKRLGNAIYMDELIEWIGSDAVRYSLARYPSDSPLSLDGEELRKQSNDNPVFYVQYAHARTANVARLAGDDGVLRADGFDASLLDRPHRGRAARGARRLPAGRGPVRPPARAAPGGALPRGARRPVPQVVRHLPGAPGERRRGDHRPAPQPAVAQRRHPPGARQRPRPPRGQRPRADVRADRCVRTRPVSSTPRATAAPRSTCRTRATSWSCCRSCGPAPSTVTRHGRLTVGGVDVLTLARDHGTAAYILDEDDFRSRAAEFRDGFASAFEPLAGADVYYAGKAFLCTAVARWVADEGLHLDVCTGGELAVARRAQFPAQRIGFHGNNKTTAEIREALELRRRPDRRRLLPRDRPDRRRWPKSSASSPRSWCA